MQRTGILTFDEELSALAPAQLGETRRAAWLIELETGRIVAASRDGARLFGLGAQSRPLLLDAAMPALAHLRALAEGRGMEGAGTGSAGGVVGLLFWTPKGALHLPCLIRIADGKPPIAAVTVHEEAPAHAPIVLRDDAAKLREIARRIREGHSARGRWRKEIRERAEAFESSGSPDAEAGPPPSLKARLAHELKTPVSAIAAAAEIMRDQRLGPIGTARYLDYAGDIHASAQHALAVIERMLADARASWPEGRPDGLSFAEIDAGTVLESSISQLAPLAERAGITLAIEIAPGLPHLIADATSLRQMVLNLLTNALKFTEPGGRVTLSARYTLDGPLAIAVSDTGQGMASSGSADRGEAHDGNRGLGIGLPLVRALAAANGAELVIDSAPGKGTSAAVVFQRDRVVPV